MITNYLADDIQFQEPPAPATPSPVDDLIKSLKGDTEEDVTPYKGTEQKRLDELFKTGVISEAEYRAELKARKMGDATINDKVKANAPDPTAAKPSSIKPPSMTGGAGLADFSDLSETDIVNKVKAGEWTPEQAENVLISSKGYSPGSARETVAKLKEEAAKSAPTATTRALEALGITSKMSESDIIKGAEQKLWSADDAYNALIALKEYTPAAAAAKLRLAGWKGGPGSAAPAAKPPIAGTPGELISQYRNAYGETPADTPGQLMARQARPTPQADPGAWVVSGAEAANPSMTYTRTGGGGGAGLSGVMTPTVQRPTVMTPGVSAAPASSSSSSGSSNGMTSVVDAKGRTIYGTGTGANFKAGKPSGTVTTIAQVNEMNDDWRRANAALIKRLADKAGWVVMEDYSVMPRSSARQFFSSIDTRPVGLTSVAR